ncbi:Gryzun, putative trafficking through golgi-domain-containing protein [Limtongia smithiae]|uniref:Gryzun, putative trafficking through golgi-domain-containing protein n=1 Tax=Limtongia smithiae TaxID=1125753 RepID=UPI0034CFEB3A
MDLYPVEYICHNLPLMLISGLTGSEKQGPLSLDVVIAESPADTPSAEPAFPFAAELLRAFTDNSRGRIWEPSAIRLEGRAAPEFRVLAVGKHYQLPTKKASPLSPTAASSFTTLTSSKSAPLYSPLSPLSPESPLYPDGVISQFWHRKYRNYLPAVFLSFYELDTETEDAQTKATRDAEIIKEITSLKKQFAERNVKFAAVIVSRKTTLQSTDLNDRIAYLRKNTGLDAKTGLFFVPPSTSAELEHFAKESKVALYPAALDFYASLLKHARKKRGHNGTLPASTDIDHTLSPQGWNLRYEFKQAVFAEYRQDIDLAIKLYGLAYEALIDLFDAVEVNSARWNEIRIVLDTVAFKILKCNLYLNQTVMAQKVFNVHIESVAVLVEKHFGSKNTYSFYAWKALQYQILAQLLDLVPNEISPRSVPFPVVGGNIVGPDFPSSNLLHHSGYQYMNAAAATLDRKARADQPITQPFDTYMAPTPEQEEKFDYSALILTLYENAFARFDKGDGSQIRMQSYLAYRIAQTHFESKDYENALKYFHLAEGQYRRERWYSVLGPILNDAIYSAKQVRNKGRAVKLQLENLCADFWPCNERAKPIANFLDDFVESDNTDDDTNEFIIDSENINSFIHAHFAFMTPSIHVGSTVQAQLTIQSRQAKTVGPITASTIQINFAEGMKSIIISHADSETSERINQTELKDEGEFLVGTANLSFNPDEVKSFQMSQVLKIVGTIVASSVVISFVEPKFAIKLALELENSDFPDSLAKWFMERDGALHAQILVAPESQESRVLKVKPKPSHIEISSAVKGTGYIGETWFIPLTVISHEAEDIDANIAVKVQSVEGQKSIKPTWDGESEDSTILSLGTIPANSLPVECKFSVRMPSEMCDLIVDVVVTYKLKSDVEVTVTKTHNFDLPVIYPFQISYDLVPRIQPELWPSPFIIGKLKSHSPQITKRWCLAATTEAVDISHLQILDYSFVISNIVGVDCKQLSEKSSGMKADSVETDSHVVKFVYDVTNNDSLERRTGTADANLTITWKRTNSDIETPNIFHLPVLKLTFPLLEPRVLLDVQSSSSESVKLVYYIENATSHLLTFSVSLDLNTEMSLSYPVRHQLRQQSVSKDQSLGMPSQDADPTASRDRVGSGPQSLQQPQQQQQQTSRQALFGYDQAKQFGVRVLPYTSRQVTFDLKPLGVTSGWQRVPSLRVFDTIFKKSLSVFPASDLFRIDFKSGAVFVNISSDMSSGTS